LLFDVKRNIERSIYVVLKGELQDRKMR